MRSIRYLTHFAQKVITTSRTMQWQQSIRLMCTEDPNKLIRKQPITITINQPQDDKIGFEIDWNEEMKAIYEDEKIERNRSILAPVEDESQIYAEPLLRPTYNLASYVQKSETLQKMLTLGISLHKIEQLGHGQFVLELDFERDIQPYILLLTKDIGMNPENLGKFFTKNILILKECLDDIRVRVNYLQLKRFTQENIVEIITKNPKWLSYSTREIDDRLGYFQTEFKFTGDELRLLTLQSPKLITSDLDNVRENTFTIREEFCIENNDDVKKLIMKFPRILMLSRFDLSDRYDYVSRVMGIDNDQLIKDPFILTVRTFKVKERHGFLKSIGRAQYNPKMELYVSLSDLIKGTDEEFALNIAKRPYEQYDAYLRTL